MSANIYNMKTITKSTLEAEVEGLGKIYRADVPFNEALESLNEEKAKIIFSRDLVYARVKEGRNSSLSYNGSYTREGFLYLKNKPVLLALESPLLDLELAEQAVEENKGGNYFSDNLDVYQKYREQAEKEKKENPENRKVLILPERKNYEILTEKFNEDELTLFLFKDQAENYGKFLRKNGINELSIQLVDKNYVDFHEGTTLTQLWLHHLDDWSGVNGYNRGLYYDCRVRGMFEKPSEDK